jgi:hypothetical protein
MYEPVQRCTNCGANLTIDDLRVPNCRYRGSVLPHRGQHGERRGVSRAITIMVSSIIVVVFLVVGGVLAAVFLR